MAPGEEPDYASSPKVYVSLTFGDILYNLIIEHERLRKKEGRVTASMMVCKGSTGNVIYGWSSIKQTAQTTMPLPMSAIKSIKENRIVKHPEHCLRKERLNKHGAKTVEETVKVLDFLAFYRFLFFSLLREAFNFVNSKHGQAEVVQVNTIHGGGYY